MNPKQSVSTDVVALAERIAELADWLERDLREPDKVLCNVQSLRRLGASVLSGAYTS